MATKQIRLNRGRNITIAKDHIRLDTEMVRAILDGRKTVIRRVVKDIPSESLPKSPYRPDDILWVKETWARGYIDSTDTVLRHKYWFEENYNPHSGSIIDEMTKYYYRADFNASDEYDVGMKWRPSIQMPREAARIFLWVTDVRAERLQDITEEQALQEGIYEIPPKGAAVEYWTFLSDATWAKKTGEVWSEGARNCFRSMWDKYTIRPRDRALYGWEANPWVWVISFEAYHCERIKRKEDDNGDKADTV